MGHTDSVYCVATLSDNKIASGSCDGTIKIWNTETGLLENTLTLHTSSVNSLAYLPTNRQVFLTKNIFSSVSIDGDF